MYPIDLWINYFTVVDNLHSRNFFDRLFIRKDMSVFKNIYQNVKLIAKQQNKCQVTKIYLYICYTTCLTSILGSELFRGEISTKSRLVQPTYDIICPRMYYLLRGISCEKSISVYINLYGVTWISSQYYCCSWTKSSSLNVFIDVCTNKKLLFFLCFSSSSALTSYLERVKCS